MLLIIINLHVFPIFCRIFFGKYSYTSDAWVDIYTFIVKYGLTYKVKVYYNPYKQMCLGLIVISCWS